jgi:hypothetical protein
VFRNLVATLLHSAGIPERYTQDRHRKNLEIDDEEEVSIGEVLLSPPTRMSGMQLTVEFVPQDIRMCTPVVLETNKSIA